MFTGLQYQILRKISPGAPTGRDEVAFDHESKYEHLLGKELFAKTAGRVVVDFGCGFGSDAIAMAQQGAKKVIGIDIREEVLEVARKHALTAGVQERCEFTSSTHELADLIVSVDAFEHFSDPAEILQIMSTLLRPGGEVIISFGPTWFHPFGGHLFSVFPWAHLIFSENALISWRSTFKSDGATRFGEVAGGLNQMTIAKFEGFVSHSPFRLASLELVPIQKLSFLHNRLTREFTTAIVRCRLVKPDQL